MKIIIDSVAKHNLGEAMPFEEKLFLCSIEMVSKKKSTGENNYPREMIDRWESLKRRLAQEHTPIRLGPRNT
jgi:hypothetical protein